MRCDINNPDQYHPAEGRCPKRSRISASPERREAVAYGDGRARLEPPLRGLRNAEGRPSPIQVAWPTLLRRYAVAPTPTELPYVKRPCPSVPTSYSKVLADEVIVPNAVFVKHDERREVAVSRSARAKINGHLADAQGGRSPVSCVTRPGSPPYFLLSRTPVASFLRGPVSRRPLLLSSGPRGCRLPACAWSPKGLEPSWERTSRADIRGQKTRTRPGSWVTTDVAAKAVRKSPRTIRRYIERGELQAKPHGESVRREWLVSVEQPPRLARLADCRRGGPRD